MDLLSIFYPEFCTACDNFLVRQEKVLCTKCHYEVPRTNFHHEKDNILEKSFWGRVPVERVSSYFFFQKESKYQKVIHKLKYSNYPEVGVEMGRLYGAELINSIDFKTVDYIIPVPLHFMKMNKRGYNQSEMIAKGLEQFLDGKVKTNILYRKKNTKTQTNKSRFERYKNMDAVFKVRRTKHIENKHLLLVDDILTTGSTLEGCAIALQKAANCKVSIVTLGYAVL